MSPVAAAAWPSSAALSPHAQLAALRELLLDAPRHARLRRALGAHAFHRLRLHEEFGYVRGSDFVREHLGLSVGAWFDLVHAGALLRQPAFRLALRRRRLDFSALALLGRRVSQVEALAWLPIACECTIAELQARLDAQAEATGSAAAEAQTQHLVRLRVRLPAAVVDYLQDSQELCSALVGIELSQPDALHYLLAEASSELLAPDAAPREIPAELRPVELRPYPNIRNASAKQPELPRPHDRRRLAVRLSQRLIALAKQEHSLELEADDALLRACSRQLHHAFGYRRFTEFAARELALSPSSTDEKLRRARQRARANPIELAREVGQLTQVKASILHGLCRCGVPRSALVHWIRYAAEHTTRALKRAVDWARRAFREDPSRLSSRDYRPPSASETRTSEVALSQLAKEHAAPPPGLLADQPLQSTPLLLHEEDHAVLVDLTRALHSASRSRAPLWWQLLQILALAREGMAQLAAAAAPLRRTQRQILERDRYRCQFPGCSQRRVEIHHIHFRSQGGGDDPSNLLCLCPAHHHHGVHARTIRIGGQASAAQEELIIEAGLDRRGHPLLRYQGERLVFSSL